MCWDSWLIERSGGWESTGESGAAVMVMVLEDEMLVSMGGERKSWVVWREGAKRGLEAA